LQKAVDFLKEVFCGNKPLSKIPYSKFPKQFIRKNVRDFIYSEEIHEDNIKSMPSLPSKPY